MTPFFVSIPHSGEEIPPEVKWLANLPETVLMCDVDRFVDQLYIPALKELNVSFITTRWHRYAVDLNRLPEDVDQDSVLGSPHPRGQFTTGLHWVKTTQGDTLMNQPIDLKLHNLLVDNCYRPFHQKIVDQYQKFKAAGASKVYHLDAHSMPSLGTAAHRDPGELRADFVISDQQGQSCDPQFSQLVLEAFRKTGLKVAYNWPYLGGRVTQTYGQPKIGQNAIQVETNRALYMDEKSKKMNSQKAAELSNLIRDSLRLIVNQLAELK